MTKKIYINALQKGLRYTSIFILVFSFWISYLYGQCPIIEPTFQDACGAPPAINFVTESQGTLCEGVPIVFENKTEGAAGFYDYFIINWGDDSKLDTVYTYMDVTHTFVLDSIDRCSEGPVIVKSFCAVGVKECVGGISTQSQFGYFNIELLPVASFSAVDVVCKNRPIFFMSTSCNEDTYRWDFESDNVVDDSVAQVIQTFDESGVFEVTLEVSNACGVDEYVDTITVVDTIQASIDYPLSQGVLCVEGTETITLAGNITDNTGKFKWSIFPSYSNVNGSWCFTDDSHLSNPCPEDPNIPFCPCIPDDQLSPKIIDSLLKQETVQIWFQKAGQFITKLEVENACGKDVLFDTVHVYSEPMFTAIDSLIDCDSVVVCWDDLDMNISGDYSAISYTFTNGSIPVYTHASDPDFGCVTFYQNGNIEIQLSGQGNCLDFTKSIKVDVPQSKEITLTNPIPIVCRGAGFDTLQVNVPGGTWYGPGIVDDSLGVFDPASVSPGVYTIVYQLVEEYCVSKDSLQIQVLPSQIIQAVDTFVCEYDSLYTIDVNPSGGVFKGTGIVDSLGGVFDPSVAKSGNNSILYTIENSQGCILKKWIQIEVDTVFDLELPDTIFVCTDENVVALQQELDFNFHGVDGTFNFTGQGIIDASGLWDPTVVDSAVMINVQYQTRTCLVQDSFVILSDSNDSLTISADTTVCIEQQSIVLEANLEDGFWYSSNCVIDSMTGTIDLLQSGGGACIFQYIYKEGTTCELRDTAQVTIIDMASDIVVPDTLIVCGTDSMTYTIAGFSPSNGQWSGPGIQNASLGIVNLSNLVIDNFYTYEYCLTNNGFNCTGCKQTVLVYSSLPTPNFTIEDTLCTIKSHVFLNETNDADIFSWDFGDGTGSKTKFPVHAYANPGTYEVQLEAQNMFGCVDSISKELELISTPIIDIEMVTKSGCAPLELEYTNNTIGEGLEEMWIIEGVDTLFGHQPKIVLDSVMQDSTFTIQYVVMSTCDTLTYEQDVEVYPYPFASFAYTDPEGCSPDTVQFFNTTIGNPNSFYWNMGNGNGFNTEQVPFQVYHTDTTVSTYAITLIANNVCGADTTTRNVVVYPTDVDAFFEVSHLFGCPPLAVTVTNFATQGSVVNYDFGDGGVGQATTNTTTYVYNTPGKYVITQYAAKCGVDSLISDTIRVYPQAIPNFSLPDFICSGDTVQFMDMTSNGIVDFWDFGDGTTSVENNPKHVYTVPGIYNVTLHVLSEGFNCPSIITKQILVPEIPLATFDYPANICAEEVIEFTNNSVGGKYYMWDFGDGSGSEEISPKHAFNKPGTYKVVLSVFDEYDCKTDAVVINVVVNPNPESSFYFVQDTICQFHDTLKTVNTSKTFISSIWKHNDVVITDQFDNVAFSIDSFGVHSIELISQNSFGCQDSFELTLDVLPSPIAKTNEDAISGCQPLQLSIASISENTDYVTWFLDGTNTSNDSILNHTILDENDHSVMLVASNNNGCPNDTTYVAIDVFPRAVANFELANYDSCGVPQIVQFKNLSKYSADYFWNFGNGETSTFTDPSVMYQTVGAYIIELIANNGNNCPDTTQQRFEIFTSPVSSFDVVNPEFCAGQQVFVENYSQDFTEYKWLLNKKIVDSFPVAIDVAGSYDITLITNFNELCYDTLTLEDIVTVYEQPIADFEYKADIDPFLLGDVQFINTSEYALYFNWDFGDGNGSTVENPLHEYDDNGPVYVTLIAQNSNNGDFPCVDTIVKQVFYESISTFYVPNAMSPDQSFGNEEVRVFKPKGIGIASYELQIYSPWGAKIKTLSKVIDGKPADEWDGSFENQPVPQGSYLWTATIEYKSGHRDFKKGTVTVIR